MFRTSVSSPLSFTARKQNNSIPGTRSRVWLALAASLVFASAASAQSTFGTVAVGSSSGVQSVTVTSPAGGTVAAVQVLTAGNSSGDFAAVAGASTCPSATLVAGASCTQSVAFTPSAPGLRIGAVVLLDAGGNVLGTGYISGTGKGGLGVITPGNMVPYAGINTLYSSVIDGQPATQAELYLPAGITMDGEGNLYIADSLHDRIRMVCGQPNKATIAGTTCTGAGIISTIAGNGNSSFTGDGGLASASTLNRPDGLTIDGAGNLYIADTGNNRVRMIAAATGVITTVVGNGAAGNSAGNAVGDGGLATAANLNQPWGVTVDASGNLYIADTYNHRIRMVSVATGIISTVAGTGKTATNGDGDFNGDNITAITADLSYPHGVTFDAAGNMYIPDTQNNRVRKVAAVGGAITAASVITTFAGSATAGLSGDGGAANLAELYLPSSVAIDPAGNFYIADTQNNAIRKVVAPSEPQGGLISTVVLSGTGEFLFNGSTSGDVLYGPMALYIDPAGNLFVADYFDMVVREVQSNFVLADFSKTPVRQGNTSATIKETVENDGNDALDLLTLAVQPNGAIDSTVSNACTAGSTLPIDADCSIGAVFAPGTTPPLTANQTETSSITATEDMQPTIPATSNPLTVDIMGIAEPLNGTTTTVSSNPDPSNFGQSVTFTVNVTTGTGTGNLTGMVAIADTYQGNTSNLVSSLPLTLSSSGTSGSATFSITTLGAGQHTIVATYGGDSMHFVSTSTDNGVAPLIQTVVVPVGTTLTSSLNPSLVGQPVTFTATVSSASGAAPTGTIQFMDGASPLGSPVTLTASGTNGVATLASSALANGVHPITAVYSGDPSKELLGNTSNTVNQDVQVPSALGLTSSLNPSFFGNPVTFTATVTSTATSSATGTIIFLDNGAQIGTGTLSGNPAVATFTTTSLAVGTHPITATYAGDNYNAASTSTAPVSQVVSQAQTSTIVIAAPSPAIAGAAETITATVSITAGSLAPTGTVTFTSGSTTLGSAQVGAGGKAVITPALAPGSYQIVATYAGMTQAVGSVSPAVPLSVLQATTQTAVNVSPNPGLVTLPITFTATVTGNGGTPGGTVNFTANGNSIGAASLNASGVATITVSTLPVGAYTVSANYTGDTNDVVSSAPNVALNVILATTSTSLIIAPNPAYVTQTVTFTAKVTGAQVAPTGTVSFIANGTTIGAVPLVGGVATFTDSALPNATYNVTAVYSGDSANATSTSPAVTESIGLIPTQTDIGISSTSTAAPQIILVASVLNGATGPMPTGSVTFMNGNTQIGAATVNPTGVATLIPSLTNGVNYSITAVYSGDAAHSPSTSIAITVNGTATGFNIATNPPTLTFKTGQNIMLTVNLSSINNFTDTVAFGCGSLPVGVTCHFAPANVTLGANGTATSQLTIDTNNPLSGGSTAMNRSGSSSGTFLAGIFLPFSVFFGWFFWRFRRRNASFFTAVLVIALSAATLFATGCNGISMGSVAPGTYSIQVIGTGTGSNVVHYQNETLTITQ